MRYVFTASADASRTDKLRGRSPSFVELQASQDKTDVRTRSLYLPTMKGRLLNWPTCHMLWPLDTPRYKRRRYADLDFYLFFFFQHRPAVGALTNQRESARDALKTLSSLFVYSHTESVMGYTPPHRRRHFHPPTTSLPPLPDGAPLLLLLLPYFFLFIYLFIYLSLPLRLCGLPFLISSVKHDYYLLMPKLRGHSFCHPRRRIFPAQHPVAGTSLSPHVLLVLKPLPPLFEKYFSFSSPMAWRNPHRQTISDLSAFPKHLLRSPALLELPHWLLVNYANKVMFRNI